MSLVSYEYATSSTSTTADQIATTTTDRKTTTTMDDGIIDDKGWEMAGEERWGQGIDSRERAQMTRLALFGPYY
jgi:hypothetical protein